MLRSIQAMTQMARNAPKDPLIAIIGATGTGKSQLAVSIAERFNGEIINGDAMQLYAGLPIITNKITQEEKHGIPHHLLGCIHLDEQTWTVGQFVKSALERIQEIRSRGRLPILVGGTHYYTQSLLFHDRLAGEADPGIHVEDTAKTWPVLGGSTESILEKLRKVDPVMADRWHPNDRRKIQRSLEIWLKTGKRASDVYDEQRKGRQQAQRESGDNSDGVEGKSEAAAPSMRFPTLIHWVHAGDETLRARLDGRVDKMLDQGLLDEVQMLNEQAIAQSAAGTAIDETRGIWVSIGYKEFKLYQETSQTREISSEKLEKLREEASEKTKIATRQYAKRQVRWIRIKLMNALLGVHAADRCFVHDASDIQTFTEDVGDPAADLTQKFLAGDDLPKPTTISAMAEELLTPKQSFDLGMAPEKWVRQVCDLCNMTAVTDRDWQKHVKSRSHRKAASKKKQREAGLDARARHEQVMAEKLASGHKSDG